MVKRFIAFAAAVLCVFKFFGLSAAADIENDTDKILEKLYIESGADELIYALPGESRSFLSDIGLNDLRPFETNNITPTRLTQTIRKTISENVAEPLRVLLFVIAAVVISSALDTVKGGLEGQKAMTLTAALCVTLAVAPPLIALIGYLGDTITAAGNFMLAYIPVMGGLIAAGGFTSLGNAYCTVMIYSSNVVEQACVAIVIPLMKCILALSVTTSACDSVRLDSVIDMFRNVSRIILTFCMSLFVAFLTMRSIVAAAADSLANRAVKFAVSSFVPMVGGALSDAYQTLISCVSVLKSGVGAAAIAAVFAVFAAPVIRCMIWQAVTITAASICDLFGMGRLSTLMRSCTFVLSVMFAVMMCTMMIYLVTTAVVIIVGRG